MKKNNATFIQRLLALMLDLILVSIISSLLTYPLINNDNYKKLSNEATNVIEEYLESKITAETYINRSADISYDLSRVTGLSSIITIAIYILYFVVYQWYNKGQTIGKKILKIKLVSSNDNDLTLNGIALRSLLINFILVDMIMIVVIIFGSKDVYFVTSNLFQSLQYIFVFITAIMILSRKDKRGLHDVITHTKVEKVEV